MDNVAKQLFEQFDAMQVQLIEQALETAHNVGTGAVKSYKWTKTRDLRTIFAQYVNTTFDNVLFAIKPVTEFFEYVYISAFTNVDLKSGTMTPYPIENNTIDAIIDVIIGSDYPLNVIFKKPWTSNKICKWGYQIC